jgi:diguanylate cyclase (GGDEF)-like protein/PAS domain S-box-containing protein
LDWRSAFCSSVVDSLNAEIPHRSHRNRADSRGASRQRDAIPRHQRRVAAEWRDAARDKQLFQAEVRFLREDKSIVWTRLNATAMRDGGTLHGYVQTVENITERKMAESVLRAAEESLFLEKERAQVTLNSIGDAVLTTDVLGNVTYLNLVAEEMTGWSREEGLGRPLAEVFKIVDGASRQAALNPGQRAMSENKTVGLTADCVLIRRDGVERAIEDSGAPIHSRNGRIEGAVLVFHDVSESRAMKQKMAHLAQHDFLTDLPNRALLNERLSQAIGLADRHRRQVALMFLDLDNFKYVNDSLGHMIGDQLLQAVAACLSDCVRGTDTISRQGGDEFVILLAEIEQPRDVINVAEKLLSALAVPLQISGHEIHVTLSIGISIYPDDAVDAETMMRNADTAMYAAKTGGRNNYQFFKAEMNTHMVRRMMIENGLRRAVQRGEFMLHYQPQIDLVSGRIAGIEALIRWRDPELGIIYPEQFILIAEESGLIVPIGRWVLREACRQVKAWLDAGLRAVPVAVNISAAEFRCKDFREGVAKILKETGLPPRYLELELTENVLMRDAEASISELRALKAMGLHLAIDDFGTGYSSLSYLKRFPIDTLKIDQSFVRDVATNEDDAIIVGAVIGMGRNLKQRVIAKGELSVPLRHPPAPICAMPNGPHHSLRLLWVFTSGGSIMKQLSKYFAALLLAFPLVTVIGCASSSTQEGTGEYIDDSVITSKVKAAIFNEPNLKSTEINVETFKGIVQLSGFVKSEAAASKAMELARAVKGVKSVKNDMRIK